ncbi:MAG: carbon-nitrogen hydrolase family protein [Pseudomonadota bacterium]
MTKNRNLKRRVRGRAAKTGESYTAALRHVRQEAALEAENGVRSVRLAVAQTTHFNDPRDISGLRAIGSEVRRLMREAREASARIVHFPEGATCSPHKRIMSATGPGEIGPSDWSRFPWDTLREELEAIARHARDLEIWTVLGSIHRLSEPHRPHNSLYVLSDRGDLETRYDERLLSKTKVSFMYSPGNAPITFEVDGVSFGCALGMESHFPEIFAEYERLDVDCVLFSTTGESVKAAPTFASEVLGHAANSTFWVSYSAHTPQSVTTPAGIGTPEGEWAARCKIGESPGIAVAEITTDPNNLARPWRRGARSGLYEPHQVVGDPRSYGRSTF